MLASPSTAHARTFSSQAIFFSMFSIARVSSLQLAGTFLPVLFGLSLQLFNLFHVLFFFDFQVGLGLRELFVQRLGRFVAALRKFVDALLQLVYLVLQLGFLLIRFLDLCLLLR